MRSYNEQKFSTMPSIQPLKSPSPDFKNKNALFSTLSPAHINMNINMMKMFNTTKTPPQIKQYNILPTNINARYIFDYEQFNHENSHYSTKRKNELNTSAKTSNHKRESSYQYEPTDKKIVSYEMILDQKADELQKVIDEKDMIINELKSTINMMTQNGKYLKKSYSSFLEQNYENMKNQVKILTIQNQKLLQVINQLQQKCQFLAFNKQIPSQKTQNSFLDNLFSKQLSVQNQKTQIQENYKNQLSQIKKLLHQKQVYFEKQIDQLIKSHKSLALECKMYQNEKQSISKENQRLINLLKLKEKEKQTGYGNYSYIDKVAIQYQPENQRVNSIQINTKSSSKTSIQKIKSQYEQNLRQYKQNIQNQIQNMFQTITLTLEEITVKLNIFEQKITEFQNMKFVMSKIKKNSSQVVNSHLISQQVQSQDDSIKSAIYIEQAPSSETISVSEKKSRQKLSIIMEDSRRDNQKLEMEISQLKNEVNFYKEKLEKNLSERKFVKKDDQSLLFSDNKKYILKIEDLQNLVRQLKLRIEFMQQEQKQWKKHNNEVPRSNESIQLNSAISRMSHTIQIKQKQMLSEIQNLQTIILQTQKRFKTQKESQNLLIQKLENENKLLQSQIQELKNQNKELIDSIQEFKTMNEMQQEANYELLRSMQQKFSIQTTKLHEFINPIQSQNNQLLNENEKLAKLCEQRTNQLQQFERYLQKYKQTILNEDTLESIMNYITFLQKNTENLLSEETQLLEEKTKIDNNLIYFNQQNLLLKEQVKYLKSSIQVYQKQAEERKTFC